ncbi:MAG: hypothetical protein AAGH41_13085 [Pseudomonadota bacterium]
MTGNFQLYTDAILLFACLGTVLYCMRIQRALRQLQTLDGGVGKAITELNQAVKSSQDASVALRDELAEAVVNLDNRYADLKTRRVEIDDLLDAMDGQMGLQLRRCKEARQLTEQALTPLVRKAEMEIQSLTKALELKASMERRHEDKRVETPRDPLDELWAELAPEAEAPRRRMESLQTDDSRPYNPFLRAVGD